MGLESKRRTVHDPWYHKTKKGLLFQVNLLLGRKRNTLLWGSKRNVAPSTTLGTTKHINNEKRLTFSSKPFFGEKAAYVVMGLESKRRTVHDPQYHKTPKNEKRLTFSSKPFFGEKAAYVVMGLESKRRTVHDPWYHKTKKGLLFQVNLLLGRKMGLEPTTLGTTNRCSNRLSYKLHFDRNLDISRKPMF